METLPAVQHPFAEPNQEIDLRRAWATIARSAWIIVVCVGLAVAAAVVAVRRLEPRFEASATVRIEDKKPAGPMSAMYYFGNDAQSTLAMASEVITSRTLATDIVDQLGLRLGIDQPQRTMRSSLISWARLNPDAPSVQYRLVKVAAGHEVRLLPQDTVLGTYPDTGIVALIGGGLRLVGAGRTMDRLQVSVSPRIDVAEALRASIDVAQTNKDANVLRIRYVGPDPDLTLQIPNAIARAFVKRRLELDRSGANAQVDYLQRQLATLSSDVADAETKIREYLEAEKIPSVGQEQQILATELGALETSRRELELQRDNIARALEPLRDADTTQAEERFLRRLMATTEFIRTGIAAGEVGRLEALLSERSTLLTRRSRLDPDVQRLSTRIAESQGIIRQRTLQYVSNLDVQLKALEPRLNLVNARLQRVPLQAIEFSKLERNRKILDEMITLVQSRLKESEIQAAVADSTASVLDEAVAANPQGGSSQTLIFAVAVFSGLLVGVAVAFLRDWLDTTVRTEVDLANIVGVTVVGIIPNLQQQARSVGYRLPSTAGGDDAKPAAGREYQTPAAEAYRTLRTNLNYLTPPKPPHVIVITSALPGDGKTTTSVNLAVTLAHQGQRVILIDAETRRGTVHDVFGIPPAPGFFDLMYGQASPGECIRRVQMEGGGTIDVLPLGSAPSVNPADLLVAGRLQPLFERLRAQYDYVLIDTPPLNLFTDAALIGAHADALLLVARADKTDRDELRFAVQQLRNVQVTLAGTILNDVEFRRGSRYRMGYGYYYDNAR